MAVKINNGGYMQNFNPQNGKYEKGKAKGVNYINNSRKLSKINELAKNGDKKAKDFLFNFREMEEKEVNEYLATIPDEEAKTYESVLDKLIENEQETLTDYHKAKDIFKDNNEIVKIIATISEEKAQHLKVLEELKEKIIGEKE